MTARERLPNRRRCESFSVECANLAYTATIARFGDTNQEMASDAAPSTTANP